MIHAYVSKVHILPTVNLSLAQKETISLCKPGILTTDLTQPTQLSSITRELGWFQVSGIQAHKICMPQVESICFPLNAPRGRSKRNKYFSCSEQDELWDYL
ncbi:ceruloplasmin [Platysternon megacephalum]|uniref:Ceruloplasmin n=1 Tax=Platysternon megacephalum TaxID=55544 RepID=A0A4D9E8H6_9SAUR|nr:ceruloplasmin [Platysternon megacephalum]